MCTVHAARCVAWRGVVGGGGRPRCAHAGGRQHGGGVGLGLLGSGGRRLCVRGGRPPFRHICPVHGKLGTKNKGRKKQIKPHNRAKTTPPRLHRAAVERAGSVVVVCVVVWVMCVRACGRGGQRTYPTTGHHKHTRSEPAWWANGGHMVRQYGPRAGSVLTRR